MGHAIVPISPFLLHCLLLLLPSLDADGELHGLQVPRADLVPGVGREQDVLEAAVHLELEDAGLDERGDHHVRGGRGGVAWRGKQKGRGRICLLCDIRIQWRHGTGVLQTYILV